MRWNMPVEHAPGSRARARPALAFLLVQHVAEIAEAGLQAHHPALAQGVDGRVGDLAEVLAEVM